MSVYFYHLPVQNLVKIGTSKDVTKRLAQLNTGCTEQGVLLRVIENFSFSAEKWLHSKFENLRVKGEWFKYCPTMLTVSIPDEYESIYDTLKDMPLGYSYQIPTKGLIILNNPITEKERRDAIHLIVKLHRKYNIPL